MPTKICIKCNTEKDYSEYYIRNGQPVNTCKECSRIAARTRYQNNDSVKQRSKECFNSFKSRNPEYMSQYAESHQDKYKDRYKNRYSGRYKERQQEYYQNNKEKYKEYNKKYNKENNLKNRLRKRGCTLEEYTTAMSSQNGKCAICHTKFVENDFKLSSRIDHDHNTGSFRGLLCNSCNVALGHFKDSVENLQRAIIYLS